MDHIFIMNFVIDLQCFEYISYDFISSFLEISR